MTQENPAVDPADRVGLCARCRHGRQVPTPRSTFWLCERSVTDPGFEKYPRLPIRSCRGFESVGVPEA